MTTLLLALALLAPQDSVQAQARGILDRDELAALVEPYLEQKGVPGAVIALVLDGRPALVEAFGVADLESGAPMQAATRFQVGSVTKPVTATLVALLAEGGVLGLDDPISAHVPEGLELPAELAPITLRQLASHTSGLPREAVNRRNLPDTPSVMVPMSVEELFAGLAQTEFLTPPGEAFAYSNLGFALLGALAAEAAKRPYAELVSERVLAPLGMESSGVWIGEEPENLATCYWPEDAEPIARAPWRFGTACGFIGLTSTGPDLARFLAAQMESAEGAVLSPGTRALLHTPVRDAKDGLQIAFSWFSMPMPGGLRAVAHGGEVDGHSAMMVFFPDLRAGLVVLCNLGGREATEGLAQALMGDLLPKLMAGGR